MRFFTVYQYLVPALLFPLSYLLWLGWYDGNHALVGFTLAIPVVFAYVIPGLGTNWLKLWEINTALRIGRFRPHHGFVFGTGTSLLTLLAIPEMGSDFGVLEVVRAGFVVGGVLAFWNWLYDIAAIRAGFITVYNRPFHEGRGPEAIATDYAPVLFGVFGVCYGVALRTSYYVVQTLGRADLYWPLLAASIVVSMVLPVMAFCLQSYVRHGDWGLARYERPVA
ncbi:MAG TPA: hypothetical protein VLA09_02800 [Longimicrobiales bacterium]|nr:hypothetical protein [Longimicrobiales bacterium]